MIDETGSVVYVMHRVEDVTDRTGAEEDVAGLALAEATLRESEARFRLMADPVPRAPASVHSPGTALAL